MVIVMREFRRKEFTVAGQPKMKVGERRESEPTLVNADIQHMPPDAAVVAEEMQMQTRHRDALIDARHPESDERSRAFTSGGLELLRRDVGERPERRSLTMRDTREDVGEDAVDPHRMEEVATEQTLLHRRVQAGEVEVGDRVGASVPETTDVDERQELIVGHRARRGVGRALPHFAVDDDDLAAEPLAAPHAGVAGGPHICGR